MFTHIIRGDGRRITYQNAGVDCAFVAALSSGFCNWRIDFSYADTDNRTYRTSRGRTHTECKIDPMRNNSPQTLPRYGKACAHLYVNGVRRVSHATTSRSEPFMVAQQQRTHADQAWEARRKRAGIAAFLVGLGATLAFFALWPGLPHVIDWGAVLAALAVGGLARWSCRSWMTRTARRKPGSP
ncbi:hypothetical protein AB5J72_15610 [Streptomyces sp. CG1]|uniref:hypothetical protein n=1 Tax=Streptomyces sp. CG1 TaxID=1287523 RepID=UPI0034E28C3D